MNLVVERFNATDTMYIKFSAFVSLFLAFYATGLDGLILWLTSWFATYACLVYVIWKLSHKLTKYYILNQIGRTSGHGKTVVITGCDTGFGHLTALRLNKAGFYVIAGCLNPDSDNSQRLMLDCQDKSRMQIVKLDVTSAEDIQNVKSTVEEVVREKSLQFYALVNNAGYLRGSMIEWHQESEMLDSFRRTYDVNVFGGIHLTRVLLPLLRKNRAGRVVTVTSIAVQLVCAGIPAYVSSKHAMSAFCESLDFELQQFSIRSVRIEPWGYKTELMKTMVTGSMRDEFYNNSTPDVQQDYRTSYEQQVQFASSLDNSYEKDPNHVAEAIYDGITSAEPDPIVTVMSWKRKLLVLSTIYLCPNELRSILLPLTIYLSTLVNLN